MDTVGILYAYHRDKGYSIYNGLYIQLYMEYPYNSPNNLSPYKLMLYTTHKHGRNGDGGWYCFINNCMIWKNLLNRGTQQIWCILAYVLIGGLIVLRHISSQAAKGNLDFTPKELVSMNAPAIKNKQIHNYGGFWPLSQKNRMFPL